MLELNLAKAKELVDLAISEKGSDYVYAAPEHSGTCVYVHGYETEWDEDLQDYVPLDNCTLTPGCIVGNALNKGGIKLEAMTDRNEAGSYDLVNSLEGAGELRATSAALHYLELIQSSQDRGIPWGVSNEAALKGQVVYPERDERGQRVEGKYRVSGLSADAPGAYPDAFNE